MDKKYLNHKELDSYAKSVSGNYWTEMKTGDFDKTELKEAFLYVKLYQQKSKFERVNLELGKEAAEKLLNSFEAHYAGLKEKERIEREKQKKIEAAYREEAPKIFAKEFKPLFDDLEKRIEQLKQRPGYSFGVLHDHFETKLRDLEALANVKPIVKKIYPPQQEGEKNA